MAESPKQSRSPLGRLVGVTIGIAFVTGDLVDEGIATRLAGKPAGLGYGSPSDGALP